jgi:cytochrome c oxidase cbb3-type subunit 3
MADNTHSQTQPTGTQTTGHVWDGDLQELNNPLPAWWTYAFYASMVFALVYWIIFPSWPIGKGFLTGMSTITYANAEGKEEAWHWNTRAKLLKETQEAVIAQKPYYDKVASYSYEQIANSPELSSFVISAGKAVFSDNCAACHQAGGQGKVGFFPNLTDDDWLYGGSFEKINETLHKGRRGYMPPFAEALDQTQIDELANYVLSLTDNKADQAKALKGKALFHSQTAACYYCHGENAKGRPIIGSANLTDKVWLWADVPGAKDEAGKINAIKQVITAGLNKGVMPAWDGRLNPEQIKLLTVYVHELGGGK